MISCLLNVEVQVIHKENEDYKFYSGSGNVKRLNVEARYEILCDECYKYFKLELPSNDENSELVADDASVIDETSADVKNSERVYEEVVADEEAV